MFKKTFRMAALCLLVSTIFILPQTAMGATSAPFDMTVQKIDARGLVCGSTCGGSVVVQIANKGRALSGGYNIFVDLKVYEQGQGQRAKTYKEKVFNFPAEASQEIKFDNIRLTRCNRPYVVEAKVYVVGGNLREGNTRNNDLQYKSYVRNECKAASSSNGNGGSGGYGGSSGGSSTGTNRPAPRTGSGAPAPRNPSPTSAPADLLIANITPDVECGSYRGTVDVEVANAGRALDGGYNVFVELKVYEQGQGQRARTYKLRNFNFPGADSKDFTFKGVHIQRCGRPYVFESKVYVVGGNFREGNTRNNDKQVTQTVYESR